MSAALAVVWLLAPATACAALSREMWAQLNTVYAVNLASDPACRAYAQKSGEILHDKALTNAEMQARLQELWKEAKPCLVPSRDAVRIGQRPVRSAGPDPAATAVEPAGVRAKPPMASEPAAVLQVPDVDASAPERQAATHPDAGRETPIRPISMLASESDVIRTAFEPATSLRINRDAHTPEAAGAERSPWWKQGLLALALVALAGATVAGLRFMRRRRYGEAAAMTVAADAAIAA